ncbi:MAG TPA: glycosyltransferase family 9 protein [Syntrophobacter fumaroxidans]|nr:glycosyltransferase family 9 protein [Syntrophobacter fumaroxidans]
MNARQKIRIDRLFGAPVAYMLNVAARVLGCVLRRDHSLPAGPGAICVAKFVGMGSILSAVPMLQSIRRRYPRARLVFISSRNNAPLLERMNLVDECFYISEASLPAIAGTTLKVVWKLWRLRPELYLDLELYSFYSSILATLSCARNRAGFYRKSTEFKDGLFTHLIFFNTGMPVEALYLQMAIAAGAGADHEAPEDVSIAVLEKDRDEFSVFAKGWLQPGDRLLAVNPNASDLCLERRWPTACFAETIEALLDRIPSLKVVLTGSPGEREHVEELSSMLAGCRERVRNAAGRLSLGTFLALLNRADCFLTNDSGPMHMALALKRPTVALFGPGHPTHYVPRHAGADSLIFYEHILCSPCLYHSDLPPCRGDNQCMKMISSEKVTAACLALLWPESASIEDRAPPTWEPAPHRPINRTPDGRPLGTIAFRH